MNFEFKREMISRLRMEDSKEVSPPSFSTARLHQEAKSVGHHPRTSGSANFGSAAASGSLFAFVSVADMRVFDICSTACSKWASLTAVRVLAVESRSRTQLHTAKLGTPTRCQHRVFRLHCLLDRNRFFAVQELLGSSPLLTEGSAAVCQEWAFESSED